MPLRLIEATLPPGDRGGAAAGGDGDDGVAELLDGQPVVHRWTTQAPDGSRILRVLVEAEDTEAVSDRLVGRYGSREGFRVILLAVEATLPPVEAPKGGEEGDPSERDREGPRRISREEMYEDVTQASRLTGVYVVMVALSTVVAAVGLLRSDVAIVVGAMVIAPLLGPNVALSLAATLGDPALARRSLRAIGVGVGTAALLSLAIGSLLEVDPAGPELAARTGAGIGDVALALAAGSAGALAFTSGVPAVVVGVMVAVALLPPLVAAGLLAGAGYGALALGALTLVVTNVTCINLAAVATFLVQRVRPRTWWEADRAKRATRLAVATWVVMLVLLVALFWFGGVGVR